MGVQDIIVMIILVVCMAWMGRHTYLQIQRHKNHKSLCSGCGLGCSCSKSSFSKPKGKTQNSTPSCCSGKKDAQQKSECK